jgi:glutathione-regulated potassium-efflux system ancillary protein KefF
MVVVIFAHPYPDRSRANRRLIEAVSGLDGVTVRSLYDLYPGFDIDVPAEQALLAEASAMVWQHPMYWYSVPGLLKHWFDKVLARGWAYGDGTFALEGKRCLWVTTTGGDEHAFTPAGMHGHPFESFVPAVEQTARFCRMHWEEPLVLRGAHRVPEATLDEAAQGYRARLERLLERPLQDSTARAP